MHPHIKRAALFGGTSVDGVLLTEGGSFLTAEDGSYLLF
jgi:hypothetical protein